VVLGLKPVRLLEKTPVPELLVVELSDVVGLELVDQQTPLAVTVPPPSEVILPPDTAVVNEIEVTAVVVRVGTWTAWVVKDTSLP
jgi:hypothetical protein